MKAWIISDTHISRTDFLGGRRVVVPEADICNCAGDIAGSIERTIDFLFAEIAPHMTVVAVLGNHDFYGGSIARALEYARKWTAGTNVHILEDEVFQDVTCASSVPLCGQTSKSPLTRPVIFRWT